LRRLISALTLLIAVPVLFYAASLLGSVVPGARADLPQGADQYIGLVRGPIHYDLLLPMTPAMRAHFGFAQAAGVPLDNPDVEWLIVGWGAREFYTSTATLSDMKASAVWHGVTGDSSVMHLDVAGNLRGVDAIEFLPLSGAQMAALLATIDAKFQRDQAGRPIALSTRFSDHDAFFEARGAFSIFYTCNAWIGSTLRAAGVPFGIWTPTPQAVEISLKRLAAG
jgi:uncharacterized protein (TIGR02117 family)